MIDALIIDDEPQARSLLRNMLLESPYEINIVAECESLSTGVVAIRKKNPQLVFLDIEMPGHSGLEISDFFSEGELNFHIIFVTAYHEYAIKAFKLSAVDYVLKPLNMEDLIAAISLYEKRSQSQAIQLLRENLKLDLDTQIAVPTSQSVQFIRLSEILYMKGEGSYTELTFVNEKKLLVSRNLKNFEDVLQGNDLFFRCHKSFLVNTHYITSYDRSEGGHLILNEKHQISIAQERVSDLLKLVKIIKR